MRQTFFNVVFALCDMYSGSAVQHSYTSLIFTDLVSQNIDVTLNRKNSMRAVIKIIEENIPEVWMWSVLVAE